MAGELDERRAQLFDRIQSCSPTISSQGSDEAEVAGHAGAMRDSLPCRCPPVREWDAFKVSGRLGIGPSQIGPQSSRLARPRIRLSRSARACC
jgi:hypothetical protein